MTLQTNDTRFKCLGCLRVFAASELEDAECPRCNSDRFRRVHP